MARFRVASVPVEWRDSIRVALDEYGSFDVGLFEHPAQGAGIVCRPMLRRCSDDGRARAGHYEREDLSFAVLDC